MERNMTGSLSGVIDEMLSGSVAGNIQFESSGGSSVTITPTLESGTKIADFTIDDTSGILYAPTPEQPIEYTAGENIQISEENVISATDTIYTAGSGISIENNVISSTSSYQVVPLLSTPTSSSGIIQLSDDITNYNQVEIVIRNNEDQTYVSNIYNVNTFLTLAPYTASPVVSSPHFFQSIWQPSEVFARIIAGNETDSIYPFQLNNCTLQAVNGIKF